MRPRRRRRGRMTVYASRHDPRAVAAHHLQRQHALAHGAVAHRIGAGGAGRGHAAERGNDHRAVAVDTEPADVLAELIEQRIDGHQREHRREHLEDQHAFQDRRHTHRGMDITTRNRLRHGNVVPIIWDDTFWPAQIISISDKSTNQNKDLKESILGKIKNN